jgi:endonuclease-3
MHAQTLPSDSGSAKRSRKKAATNKPATKTAARKAAANKPAAKRTAAKKPAAANKARSAAAPARRPAARRLGVAERQRIAAILDLLDELYPDSHCELDFRNPFELLVAVILSAQCTDDRVNQVTPALFRRYPDARALAESDQGEVERMIYSTGFFRNKAKNIRAAARKLVEKHAGEVPRSMDELLALPGVARKTANVVLGTAYGIPSGVVVDTHIARLAKRLGMTRHEDPVRIERDLMAQWPQERWIMSGHRLIWHGRRVCAARKPDCGHCRMAPLCPSAEPL